MSGQTIYIAGKVLAFTPAGNVWTVLGVFSSEESARELCVDSHCFVGVVDMDQATGAGQSIGLGFYAYHPFLA